MSYSLQLSDTDTYTCESVNLWNKMYTIYKRAHSFDISLVVEMNHVIIHINVNTKFNVKVIKIH